MVDFALGICTVTGAIVLCGLALCVISLLIFGLLMLLDRQMDKWQARHAGEKMEKTENWETRYDRDAASLEFEDMIFGHKSAAQVEEEARMMNYVVDDVKLTNDLFSQKHPDSGENAVHADSAATQFMDKVEVLGDEQFQGARHKG
jgi:hypothetical protein